MTTLARAGRCRTSMTPDGSAARTAWVTTQARLTRWKARIQGTCLNRSRWLIGVSTKRTARSRLTAGLWASRPTARTRTASQSRRQGRVRRSSAASSRATQRRNLTAWMISSADRADCWTTVPPSRWAGGFGPPAPRPRAPVCSARMMRLNSASSTARRLNSGLRSARSIRPIRLPTTSGITWPL